MAQPSNIWPWHFNWDNLSLGANILMAMADPSLGTRDFVAKHFTDDVLLQERTPGQRSCHTQCPLLDRLVV